MHHDYLKQALDLAKERKGYCAPNPSVGAVIVKNNQIIAKANHEKAGNEHAELKALQLAGGNAKGATLYITLEPCCHFGKTPPCTNAIIKSKIAKVYYAQKDPNPKVNTQGMQLLNEKGIPCELVTVPEVSEFYRSYCYWWESKRPYVTGKLALSLDGKIAGKEGSPEKLTGETVSHFTHLNRQSSDAIFTTARTLNQDNPQLNVRLEENPESKPIYILDRNLTLKMDLQIYESAKSLILFHSQNFKKQNTSKIRYVAIPEKNHHLDLSAILNVIGGDGIHDLWLEAGGQCFEVFLQQRLLQKAYFYIAPKILGHDALPAFTKAYDIMQSATKMNGFIKGNDCVFECYF